MVTGNHWLYWSNQWSPINHQRFLPPLLTIIANQNYFARYIHLACDLAGLLMPWPPARICTAQWMRTCWDRSREKRLLGRFSLDHGHWLGMITAGNAKKQLQRVDQDSVWDRMRPLYSRGYTSISWMCSCLGSTWDTAMAHTRTDS